MNDEIEKIGNGDSITELEDNEVKNTIGYRIVDKIFRIRKAITDSQPDYYKDCNL